MKEAGFWLAFGLSLATDSFAVAVSIALGTVFVAALSRMV